MELCRRDAEPRIYALPDPNDPLFQVEYDRDHPVIKAAREFLRRHQERKEKAQKQEPKDASKNDALQRQEERNFKTELLQIWQLERFFDLQHYPPRPTTDETANISAKKEVHPDLIDIKDPWYREPEQPDLIDFST